MYFIYNFLMLYLETLQQINYDNFSFSHICNEKRDVEV